MGTDSPRDAWIHDQLKAFLKGRSEWPPYREFQRAHLKHLRDEITRRGGAERWARRMGIPFVRYRPGYSPVWTEERVRQGLTKYLHGRSEWPARAEFERDSRTALRNAVNRTGGPDRWAAEFGLPRPDRRSGIKRGWTADLVEFELKRLIGGAGEWPSRRAFEEAGLASMLSSIYAHEGIDYWVRRLNLRPRRPMRGSRPRFWTEERIRTELERFCAGRETWPSERDFINSGQRALYTATSRYGGVARWAEEMGLPRGRPGSKVSELVRS